MTGVGIGINAMEWGGDGEKQCGDGVEKKINVWLWVGDKMSKRLRATVYLEEPKLLCKSL